MTLAIRLHPIFLVLITLVSFATGSVPSFAEGQTIEFRVMRDVERNIGILEIANMPDNAFEADVLTSFNTAYGERSLWLRLDNIRDAQIIQSRAILDDVTLFMQSSTSADWQQVKAGDQIAQSERALLSAFTVLPIQNTANRARMYLRVVQSTAVPIKLVGWAGATFLLMEASDEKLKLLLFGFVLATITYNIFISFLLRNAVFLFNAFSVTGLLVLSLYLSGYGVAYFWSEWTGWSNTILVASIYGATLFGAAFLWQFVKSENDTAASGWPIIYAPVFSTVVILCSPIFPFWIVQLSILIAGALLLISTLVFVGHRAWTGDQKARVLIFPLLFAVIPGLLLLTLNRVFGVDTGRYSNNTLEITICLEALLFSLALVARVRIGEQAILAANENVLRLRYENSVKVVATQDNERKRLAKELHDGVGQNFLSVVGNLKSLATKHRDNGISSSLSDVIDVATMSLNELRRISKDMHPSSIEHLGLKRAIELLFENLENSDQVETKLDLQFNEASLTPKMELNVYRIFQECLSNVSRHADATCCRAAIVSRNGMLEASIEDDGTGMKLNKEGTKGLGLISIEERTHALKGQYRISESTEGGTKVEFSFPITPAFNQETDS